MTILQQTKTFHCINNIQLGKNFTSKPNYIQKSPAREQQQATSCRAFHIPTLFIHSFKEARFTHILKTPVLPYALNQRPSAEGKAQSPFSPYALKGQKLLAQGIALVFYCRKLVAL